MMGQLRSALRAYALEGSSPAAVLEKLNRFLLSLSWDSMATALVLLLEPPTGRITYANAGHPPPLVLGADGVARSLKETLSVPLGALDVAGYEEGSATLEPGATLVLYTDGLVEQRDELIDRGIERLESALVEDGPAEPEALCERIIRKTIGGEANDDVTLLVVQASMTLGEPHGARAGRRPRRAGGVPPGPAPLAGGGGRRARGGPGHRHGLQRGVPERDRARLRPGARALRRRARPARTARSPSPSATAAAGGTRSPTTAAAACR